MFQMMGVFAEFERAMIQERVRAGLARARSEGKRLGRPPIAAALEKRIREALATPGRPGIRVIAERFGVNPSTVQRISRPFDGASVAVALHQLTRDCRAEPFFVALPMSGDLFIWAKDLLLPGPL